VNLFDDERGAELRELFFESAAELLQAMNEGGMEFEEHPDDLETLRKVRRAVHTLKGDSASCGYTELSEIAHELEDALTPELLKMKPEALAEVVLAAADAFHAMLAAYQGQMKPPAASELRALLRRVLSTSAEPETKATTVEPAAQGAAPVWTEYEQLLISQAIHRGQVVFYVTAQIAPENAMPAAAVQLVRSALSACGVILALHPEDVGGVAKGGRVEAAIASPQTAELIERKCKIPSVVSRVTVEKAQGAAATAHRDLLEVLLESEANAVGAESSPAGIPHEAIVDAAPPSIAGSKTAQDASSRKFASAASNVAPVGAENVLRVEAARIDNVMNLVGELIIGKSMLHRTIIEFESQHSKDPLRGKFADALAFQTRVLNDLQKSVMKIRMVPVEQLFRRFPRVVRDVAKQRNKDIALEMSGQNTDLDKGILDALAGPLSHLVRNAADHGIESAAERKAAGKPPRGTIRLNAYHQGNQVVIEVSDDGRGLDRERIVRTAVTRGLVTAEEAARMNEAEALHLIFTPGLSTADEVTSISGRGVGMDVVNSALERLKGSIRISTQHGKGTTFYLMMPLTLASIQALMFRVAGRLYAVALSSVVEIARVSRSEIYNVDQREVLRLRDQLFGLVRLDTQSELDALTEGNKRLFVVIMSAGSRRFGLIVDSLMGEEELVMKALEDQLVSSDLVSGASILGDGTVVLILNVSSLVGRLSQGAPLGATA
jgi:two-component system chemotaxis sensor kinase CheA